MDLPSDKSTANILGDILSVFLSRILEKYSDIHILKIIYCLLF